MAAADAENLTSVLHAALSGDANSASSLLPLVYRELRQLAARRLAGEPSGQTLQATALVHEAWLRLTGCGVRWESRAHFFGAAARAMRCILIDHARARGAQKRGGEWTRVDVDEAAPGFDDESRLGLLALDAALSQLEQRDARKAQIVMLRYFAGLTIEEVADALNLAPTTVKDEWSFARAWLHGKLTMDE